MASLCSGEGVAQRRCARKLGLMLEQRLSMLTARSTVTPPDAIWMSIEAPVLLLPIVASSLQAGFPSPADDFAVKRHDLNELLITHPQATFFWRVSGKSMVEAGIDDGDLLIVNRALKPAHNNIVVAQVDNDFTVKYLHKRNGRIKLVAANPTFPDLTFKDGQELVICGVVTCTIKRFVG
jgi:DNA polymerase V